MKCRRGEFVEGMYCVHLLYDDDVVDNRYEQVASQAVEASSISSPNPR
jgi:hypothetical protein